MSLTLWVICGFVLLLFLFVGAIGAIGASVERREDEARRLERQAEEARRFPCSLCAAAVISDTCTVCRKHICKRCIARVWAEGFIVACRSCARGLV